MSDKANPYSGAIKKLDPGSVKYDEMRNGGGGVNGKGDWTRPVQKEVFDKNFDKIDWSKKDGG